MFSGTKHEFFFQILCGLESVVFALATIATMMTTFTAPKSEAAVGMLLGQPTVMATGGASALATVGFDVLYMAFGSSSVLLTTVFPLSAGVILGGLVILEDHGTNNVQYTTLNSAQSAKLGLTKKQMSSFNANVEIFNAVADQIAMNVTAKSTLKEVTAQWKTALFMSIDG